MGRGRAKAKQTKVARELKYRSFDTDFSSLERSSGTATEGHEVPPAYADLAEEYETDEDDPRRPRSTDTFASRARKIPPSEHAWAIALCHEPESSETPGVGPARPTATHRSAATHRPAVAPIRPRAVSAASARGARLTAAPATRLARQRRLGADPLRTVPEQWIPDAELRRSAQGQPIRPQQPYGQPTGRRPTGSRTPPPLRPAAATASSRRRVTAIPMPATAAAGLRQQPGYGQQGYTDPAQQGYPPQQYGQPGYPQQPYAGAAPARPPVSRERREDLGDHLPHLHPVLLVHRTADRLPDVQGPQPVPQAGHDRGAELLDPVQHRAGGRAGSCRSSPSA